jgi:MFS family permease
MRTPLWVLALIVLNADNGVTETAATPYWPGGAHRLHLNDGHLGWVLLGMPLGLALGGLIVTPIFGRRFGSRAMMVLGGPGFFIFLALAVMAPSPWVWFAGLLFGGVCNSQLDVGWGVQATEQTRRSGRDNDQYMYELVFSVGSGVGAGFTAAALFLGWGRWAFLGLTAATVLSTVWAGRRVPAAPERERPDTAGAAGGDGTAGLGRFAALCVLRFFSFFPLGIAYAWSTTYLQRLGAPDGIAPLGLVAYTLCEGTTRLGVWKLTDANPPRRLRHVWKHTHTASPRTIVALGGFVGLIGSALMIVPGRVDLAIVGWGLLALGIGVVTPEARTTAARTANADNLHRRMSAFQVIGYFAGTVSQPLIGWTAGAITLRWSMLFLTACALIVILASGAIRRNRAEPAAEAPGAEPALA